MTANLFAWFGLFLEAGNVILFARDGHWNDTLLVVGLFPWIAAFGAAKMETRRVDEQIRFIRRLSS